MKVMSEPLRFIEKHLSEEERKQIAIEEWRSMLREVYSSSPERIVSNLGHYAARALIDDVVGADDSVKIREGVEKAISNITEWSVFRRADRWDANESPAYKMLMEAVREHKDTLDKRVGEVLEEVSLYEVMEVLKSGTITINPQIKKS